MAVNITPQAKINPLDTDWYDEAEANRQRANANDTALKAAVDALQQAEPVQKIKQGATTYSPDANGLVTLPSGVVAPATTTTERDAIVSPTIGQLIYNTTTARLEMYSPNGWIGVGTVQIDVFTASGTWTKPAGAKMCHVIAFGGGAGGFAAFPSSGNAIAPGGSSGARAQALLAAALLPATVSVTVGAGGTGNPATYPNASGTTGNSGGPSSFGAFVLAGGGGSSGTRALPGTNLIKPSPTQTMTAQSSGVDVGQIGTVFGAGASYGEGNGDVFSNSGEANLGLGPGGGAGVRYVSGGNALPGTGGSALGANAVRVAGGTTIGNGTSERVLGGGTSTSRSGSGVGGDGANGTGNVGTFTGLPGGIPGGGGGGAAGSPGAGSGSATGGTGGRGEVIVVTIF